MIIKKGSLPLRPFHVGVSGLSITITISKDGGSFAAPGNPNLGEIGATGVYNWTSAGTETDTEGALTYQLAGTGLPAGLSMPVDTVVLLAGGIVVQ